MLTLLIRLRFAPLRDATLWLTHNIFSGYAAAAAGLMPVFIAVMPVYGYYVDADAGAYAYAIINRRFFAIFLLLCFASFSPSLPFSCYANTLLSPYMPLR